MRWHFGLLCILGLAVGPHKVAWADVQIGFANPLSGPYALSGERNQIAVDLAVRDINKNGGVLGQKVTMVSVDDACGLEQSVAAARALVGAVVHVVIGHLCSHSSLLAAGLYETADILMVTPDSTHPRLTEEGRRNVFRLVGRDDEQGRLAGDFLTDRWAGEQIAILHDGSTYGEGLAAAARSQLRDWGEVEAIYDLYTPGQDDFTDLVARLRREQIEVLYVGGYGPDAGLIARTARQEGLDLQIVGGDGLAMDEFWGVAGEAGEGVIFSGRPTDGARADTATMLERFRSRGLGERTGGIGAYAAVQVWAQAVERAGKLDFQLVAEALRHASFDTVLGRVAFDRKGDLKGAAWQWMMWSDGSHVPGHRRVETQ